jgi:hypothetical protein
MGEGKHKLTEGEAVQDRWETVYPIALRIDGPEKTVFLVIGRTPEEDPQITSYPVPNFYKVPAPQPSDEVFNMNLPKFGVKNSRRHLLELDHFQVYI